MAALTRAKTGVAVAEYILGLLFDGTLRSGDRLDLDGIAATLGVSRAPVREALLQLERDGLVEMPHYRGAFVAAFDAGTIREAFELYGMLSALTSSRAATNGDGDLRETLGKLVEALAGCDRVDEFERIAREFRKVVNLATAGPHLRALLRSFNGLVPAAARFSIEDAMDEERAALHREYEALVAGDAEAASAAALDHVLMTAENAVRALGRRGIFPTDASPADSADRPQRTGRSQVLGIVRTTAGGDKE
ncbi:GntR family transcriptional regulator [Micromonospora sp. DR5-3]|uniref:GntR family transcriptional regulator n=1 Tax=unclassified Micromonospora TaxID=2617518 RepID=UPI0011D7D1B2|nr:MULTISPECIES: GntR family transcriptional regulator [unclassified Micromonospora]MCW3820311.1 GntR family transcriptional regulator [Micromonospora sp. DR5-3]TYC20121.1 GntR family transcriptional regulator [Micromonospora sp. MP36]